MKKVFLVIFIFCARVVFSQTPEQIQRHQQNLIDAGFKRQELERAITKPTTQQPQQREETPPQKSSHCVQINSIEFDGNTKISTVRIKKIAKPYLNKCLKVEEINKLLNTITNAYIDKGFITSGAYLISPQPKLNDGILQIKIVEGTITKFTGITKSERKTAFPWVLGSILNLRDIEQGLDQMNRLSSNHTKMEIKANEDVNGTSQIVITNERESPTSISVFTDDLGSKSTGEYRLGVGVVEDNLFGINDQLNLNYTNSVSGNSDKYSRALSLGFSVPLGYWNITNNASYSEYKTYMKLPISGEKLYSYGDNFTDSFIIDKVISRGQKYKLSVSVGVNFKSPNNYTKVLDIKTKNGVSSRLLSDVEYGLPMTFYFNRGVVFAKPSFVEGVDLFGAKGDDGTFPQKTQFEAYKLYLYSSWNLGFATFATTFDGQYSDDILIPSETVYIGGETSVRGFKDGVSGDSGFYIRNDFNFNLTQMFKTENIWAKSITPSLFFDYGLVKSNADDSRTILSGSGAKVAVNYDMLETSISYAIPIKKEDTMTSKEDISIYLGIKGRI